METLNSIFDSLLYPFKVPFLASSQIYWLYVLSTIVLATILYILGLTNRDKEKNLLEYLLPKEIYLHPASITLYKYFFLISFFQILLVVPTIVFLEKFANIANQILIQITGTNAPLIITSHQLEQKIIFSIFVALLGDFANFLYHYLAHKVPVLWEFHKVHHSAEVITPLTVYRIHPIEMLLGNATIAIITSLGTGIWMYFFGTEMKEILIYGVSFEIFIFYLAGYNLRHSHIWLAYPQWISHIFISPAQHQIHHSVDPKHYDKNFGYIFGFWDWIFGSLYVPSNYEKLNFGLLISDGESNFLNSVSNLLLHPFRAIWQRISKNLV
ncbi:sterol desaturase family protein [Cronbergia sp. UHCC 0137]|uniref:sterol desaturase family protein n=1 Tax=Cronbergia sp. UHCC 0137 TaxID=3110239 RepID=UPI002B20AC68|nr:sterol desaturase family protein [Cronbergia sp. UHCC 0137]MEA5617973.1 sterol desaturase family protein [Cronbergia sp. UHCC 0137]